MERLLIERRLREAMGEGSRFPVQGQGPQRRRRFQLLWLDNQPPRPQEKRPSRVSRPLPTLFWRTGLHHRDGPVVVNIIEELLEGPAGVLVSPGTEIDQERAVDPRAIVPVRVEEVGKILELVASLSPRRRGQEVLQGE